MAFEIHLDEAVENAFAQLRGAHALGAREDDETLGRNVVRVVVTVHELLAAVLVEKRFVQHPGARHHLVDPAEGLEDFLPFFEVELRHVALLRADFLVGRERHDDGAEFRRLFEQAHVAVVDERGRHVDHDAGTFSHDDP